MNCMIYDISFTSYLQCKIQKKKFRITERKVIKRINNGSDTRSFKEGDLRK